MKTQFYFPFILVAFFLQTSGNHVSAQNHQNPLVINAMLTDSAYALPFYEDWETHLLTTNQWQTSDDA